MYQNQEIENIFSISNLQTFRLLNQYNGHGNIQLSKVFFNNLKTGDVFNCHCKNFVDYLGFKRCDAKFKTAFKIFLQQSNLSYVVSKMHLTTNIIKAFINPKEYLLEIFTIDELHYMHHSINLRDGTDIDFDSFLNDKAKKTQNSLGTLELKEKDQKLNASFNGGCNLIVVKN